MPQIFHRSTNTISKVSIFGAAFLLAGLGWVVAVLGRSSYVTRSYLLHDQPVPFSHRHHVGDLGFDCRYCHTSVEESSFAGLPPTKTCMNCHQQIWVGSEMLKPVRDSYATGQSLKWQRVHVLPEFVYFDHSIHVKKGVGCSTCHGHVDEMSLTFQVSSLLMEWCLDCHRAPERYVRPRKEVFNMKWEPPPDQDVKGRLLVKEYNIHNLTSCSTCHR
jgi:hypothetical protein